MRATRSGIVLAACLGLTSPAAAQSQPSTLLDSYGRVAALQSYMTAYVGEALLACVAKNALTEDQAEARYQAYRVRNATLLERAESWSQAAEQRLRAQGQADAARRAGEAALNAVGEASIRAHAVIGRAKDAGAACAATIAAIESGRYDLSGNAEFVDVLKTKP
jgi:hypothetical protein